MKAAVFFSIALAVAGCGGGLQSAFGYHFADNQAADVQTALARLPAPARAERPHNATGNAIVVATTHGDDRQLVAVQLPEANVLWSVPFAGETRPEILGDVVVCTTREQIVGLDLASGRELWRSPLPDLGYVGAARDGDAIYWAATVGALGGVRREGHVVAVEARSGGTIWRHQIQGVFGRPAARGGLVFVPWERQNIAVLDGATGMEIARLRSTDDVIAWAFDHPSGIYYGGRGIYRLDERSVSGTQEGSTYLRPPLGELPRQPESIYPDGFVPEPGTRSARGRIRVYFTPAEQEGAIGVEGGAYYFAYYRYVFAFDAEGQLLWTRNLEQDVISAQALANGLLTVGEQGRVVLLDRDSGNDRWSGDVARELAAVDIDAAGFDPAGDAGEPRPLRQSLNELVLDPDNRLVAARAYAVAQLARIEEPEITRDLLDLYQQRSMPAALKEALREALRTRRSGEQYLMEALARRYDYLEETQAPPLEAIVPALLEMGHTAAVPQLVNHLMDHETPEVVLPQLVDAIVRLGGADALPALRSFVVLYHADSTFEGPVADVAAGEDQEAVRARPAARALALAAEGIFQHGGEEGRQLVTSLSAGAGTHEPVAAYIQGLFEAERAALARAEQEEQQAAQAALVEQQRQVEAALPRRLTQDQINSTFAENADAIRECVAGELERNPRLTQVRLVFILEREGTASDVTVSPNTAELVTCMRERVPSIQFPRFTQPMMRASFTVGVRGAEQPADSEPALPPIPDDAPWWAWTQRRAEQGGIANAFSYEEAPWWSEREPPARAEPVQVVVPEVEEELPPGMTEPRPRPVAQQPPQQQPAQQRPQPRPEEPAQREPAQGGGTPWWAGAASEDAEEEPEEQPEERPRPRRRPRP